MNGLQIQYLLGLFFALHTVHYETGKLSVDFAQLVVGVILVITAMIGATLLH